MPNYRIFGLQVTSELEFPEFLPQPPGHADVTLRIVPEAVPPPLHLEDRLGEAEVGADVPLELYRVPRALILRYRDTGTFRISDRTIDWYPGPDTDEDAARVDVKGRVLPLVLHLRGLLCLHAASVLIGSEAIAILGPKRAGKSTLSAALVAGGARFMGDDVLPVLPAVPPLAQPGASAIRLWPDSADSVSLATRSLRPGLAGKLEIAPRTDSVVSAGSYPLAAIYLLVPIAAGLEPGPRRTRIADRDAVIATLGQVKNADLLGAPERLSLLEACAQVVEATSCYQLEVPRGFERIAGVAQQILDWHAPGTADPPEG